MFVRSIRQSNSVIDYRQRQGEYQPLAIGLQSSAHPGDRASVGEHYPLRKVIEPPATWGLR